MSYVRTCASCGREAPSDAAFCAGCGAPLGAQGDARSREERKTVSVVFVDLVGSTARAERLDPEDVRAVLVPYHERVRAELERFGGTVEKFIGDAIVAVFGAPVAHEDDAERAVRAALAAQEAIAGLNRADPALELEARAGVNTGEALVAVDARPEAGEAMVSGDVINTAARLQSAAPPGGVLVGEATYRVTARAIEYREVEPVVAKGKAAPLATWLAVEPRSRLGVDVMDAGRAPLLGRDHELELVAAAFERARAGREPQLVTIAGVPGMGKSRLVFELSQLVDEDPELVVWRQGRSLPYGEGVAFWALGEMVKAQAGIFESDDAEAAAAKLAAAVADVVPEGEAAWVQRQLEPLVGIAGSTELGDERRAEAFAAWRRFFEALAEHGPTVLVFEDLQWADDGLLDFVDALVDRVAGVPLLVVASARPELLERRPGWGGGKRNAITVSLAPLSDEDTARLLVALLDRPVALADDYLAVLQRAGGNPLYAEEYARMLAAGELGSADVPDTLQGVVAARIDALPAGEKDLLQQAAVLGKVFWTDALAALSGLDGWLLDERLHALERKEFVRREHRSAVEGARQYAFVHVLVRDGAYAQMPRAVRARAHERVASWLESLTGRAEERAEMLAHHLLAALEYGAAAGLDVAALRPRAAAALVAAGDRAWSLGALPAALAHWSRARETEPGEDTDPQLLLRIGRARSIVDGTGAEELEQAAAALRDVDPLAAAEAELGCGQVIWYRGDQDASFAYFERALAAVRPLGPSLPKARVLGQVGRFHALAARPGALALAEEAIEIAGAHGDDRLLGDLLNTRGVVRAGLGDLGGIADLERSIELGAASESPWTSRAYLNLASLEVDLVGRLDRAEELLREGLELAERQGYPLAVRWLRANLVELAFRSGRWDEALREAETLEATDPGPHYMWTVCLMSRGQIRVGRGEREAGLADLAEALEESRQIRDPQSLWPALAAVAVTCSLTGDAARAVSVLEELEASMRESEVEVAAVAASYVWGALAAHDLGRPLELRTVTDVATDRSPWFRAALAINRGDLAAAAGVLDTIGARSDAAQVRLRLAERLHAEGRLAEAAHELAPVLAFYREVGAAALAHRAEAILPAAG